MICVSTVSTKLYPIVPLIHLQWLAMPDNLIFMGLHFVIGKCTQRPINLIAVWIDKYHLLIFQYTPTPCLSRTFIISYQFPIFKMSEYVWKFLANTRLNTREKIRHSTSKRWQDLSIRVHGLETNMRRCTSGSDQLEVGVLMIFLGYLWRLLAWYP